MVGDEVERRCNGFWPATLDLGLRIEGRLLQQEVPEDMSSAAGPGAALRHLLGQRIAVLDGPWGTMLQLAGLSGADYRSERLRDHPRDVAGDPDLLNLTRPDVVLDIHRQYLAAGADITTTNTFTATSIGQADYGLQSLVREMNVHGAKLARRRSEEHTSELQSRPHLVCRLLLEKKTTTNITTSGVKKKQKTTCVTE